MQRRHAVDVLGGLSNGGFALIGFSVLNAFYMQVARICLYAFADKLRTFEGGIPAASDGGFAGRTADMGVAVGCFCLIAVAPC